MASEESFNIIQQIIIDAQEVIKINRDKVIKITAEKIEQFIINNNLPVDPYFEEREFFSFNVYPIFNFLDVVNSYNKFVKESILTEEDFDLLTKGKLDVKEAYCLPYIYNFIHNIFYKKFLLVSFKNIFYPHNNNKFIFETYLHDSRLLLDQKVVCIHPKYILEEALHKRYMIDKQEFDIEAEIDLLIDDWDTVDNDHKNMQVNKYLKITNADYNDLQNKVLKLINQYIIKCFYDKSMPVAITDFKSLNVIKDIFQKNFSNYEVVENSSKSFFDNRANNYIFKIAGKNMLKLFPILDYELIPCLPWNESKTHIDVCIRLAFSEYITYRILGLKEIAEIKLRLYKNFSFRRQQLADKLLPLDKCVFKGCYYPYEIYLKDMQIKSVIANLRKKK